MTKHVDAPFWGALMASTLLASSLSCFALALAALH